MGECFYAIWMVVVSLGLLSVSDGSEGYVLGVILVAFMVNITWGLIDGTSVMYTGIIDSARLDKLVYDLRVRKDVLSRQAVRDAMSGSAVARLSPDDQERVVDMLAAGEPGEDPRKRRYYAGRSDRAYAIGILAIDFLLVFPLIIPLFMFDDVEQAAYASRLIATVAFMIIGAAYARNLHRRPWLAALFLGSLGFSVFTLTYELGW